MLLLALALTACAPSLQLAQRERASLERDGQSVVFRNPGEAAALAPSVFLRGEGLKVSAVQDGQELCTERGKPGIWGCRLPDLPGGQAFRIAVKAGTVQSGSVTFYREASGARPIYLELQ